MQIETTIGGVRFQWETGYRTVQFHRTLRLPEDGKVHALPPSLGRLPVKLVDDYRGKVPAHWVDHGGVFMPLHEREAMWMSFGHGNVPCAVKVAAGKINAVNGRPWSEALVAGVEDYMVAPPQPWLDGFNAGKGLIKQFVAMKMGQGYTVEGQVMGEEKHGGIQILMIPPKQDALLEVKTGGGPVVAAAAGGEDFLRTDFYSANSALRSAHRGGVIAAGLKSAEMGLGAGGKMRQKIYPDPHGIEVWNTADQGRVFVHVINADLYRKITGEEAPAMPQSAQSYTGTWFDMSDDDQGDISAPEVLKQVQTIAQKDKQHGFEGQQDDSPISEQPSVTYEPNTGYVKSGVRDGKW